MRKLLFCLLLFLLGFMVNPQEVLAEDNLSGEYEDSILNDMDLGEVQDAVDEMLKENSFSFGDAIREMIKGNQPISKDAVTQLLTEVITNELSSQKNDFAGILILVLAGAILANFITIFDNNRIAEISFYIVYLLMFAMLIKNFSALSGSLGQTLEGIVEFMRALSPAYYIAIMATGAITSATLFYQVILIIIFFVQYLLMNIVLPGINIYILLELINLLTKEPVLTRISELLKSAILWIQKTLLAVIVGMQMIQGLVAPAVDSLKRSVLGKTVSIIPGVGNAINAVTEIVFGSAVLIRNCLGVTALVVILVFSAAPMLQLGCAQLVYKLLGAVIQPVSDSRIVGCLHAMGESCSLLLKMLFTTQVLFILTIVILANTLK